MTADDIFGLLGQEIDQRYRVLSVVGEGAFGVVYKGVQVTFRKPVAIKCLKVAPFKSEDKATILDKFREEALLLDRLHSHAPEIVKVLDFGVLAPTSAASIPYLVLEWLEGQPLDAAMSEWRAQGRPPLTEAQAIGLLTPAMRALASAHRGDSGAVVAHRDIKPENLFLLSSGGLKLLDFGIAKVMQESDFKLQNQTRTSSGFRAFTWRYGAPEQFSSKHFGPTGPWTDVHALALVLVELVSHRHALEGDEDSDLLLAGISPERPTPRARGAVVSDAFEAICSQALSLLPRQRPQSAGELLAALSPLRSGAAAAPALQRPQHQAPADAPPPSLPGPPSAASRSTRLLGPGERVEPPAPSIRTTFQAPVPEALGGPASAAPALLAHALAELAAAAPALAASSAVVVPDELARRLAVARHVREARREREAVARVLELEASLAAGKPDEPDLLSELARVLDEQLFDPIRALSAYRRLAELRPDDTAVRERIEQIEADHGRWRELVKSSPRPESAAEIAWRSGRLEEGVAEQAAKQLEEALSADGTSLRAAELLEVIASHQGNTKRLIAALERIKRGHESKPVDERIAVHHRLARAYLEAGERDKALRELESSFRLDHSSVITLRDLGILTLDLGVLDLAREAFSVLLQQKLEPPTPITRAEVLAFLGEIARRQGDLAGAMAALEQALEQDPELTQARELLGHLVRVRGVRDD